MVRHSAAQFSFRRKTGEPMSLLQCPVLIISGRKKTGAEYLADISATRLSQ
jgi:hypothetical protein